MAAVAAAAAGLVVAAAAAAAALTAYPGRLPGHSTARSMPPTQQHSHQPPVCLEHQRVYHGE